MKAEFSHTENTRVNNCRHYGWNAETKLKVNGHAWVISTLKRSGGKISTHCQLVQDCGNGNFSYSLFGNDDRESFWLNELPKGTKATEKTIREAHFKALADFDELQQAGKLPSAKTEYKIEVGQVIFSNVPSGRQDRRVIYEIQNTSWGIKYKTVFLDGSRTSSDDHIRNYKNKFGIGVYFNEGDKIDPDLIPDLLISAHRNMEMKAAAEAAQKQINQEQQKARAEYLSQFSRADRRTTTNILKRHILKTWPAVQKLEVKTDVYSGGDSMDVTYYAPESIKDLETFVNSFQEGHFNCMEDIYEHDRDRAEIILENHILQGYKYVFCRFSAVEAAAAPVEPEAAPAPAVEPAPRGNFELVEYSEKALALFGDTKPIKDELKAIGGRFNPYLNHNGQKRAGWIFSRAKAEAIRNLIK